MNLNKKINYYFFYARVSPMNSLIWFVFNFLTFQSPNNLQTKLYVGRKCITYPNDLIVVGYTTILTLHLCSQMRATLSS